MRKLVLLVLVAVVTITAVSLTIHAYSKARGDQLILAATPNVLWPPNNKMVAIDLDAFCAACSRANPCPCCATIVIDSIESNEPIVQGVDYVANIGVNPPQLALRATRLGKGDGRTYTIHVHELNPICCDPPTATVVVTVPHDQR